jgi:hypothetical protein
MGSVYFFDGDDMMSHYNEQWPDLPFEAWQDTCETLHYWTQIVGKIRLEQLPWINHSWHVPLYVTTRGLTTSMIPYDARSFSIDFDFVHHRLLLQVSDGNERSLPLRPQSVAALYHELLGELEAMGLGVSIHGMPNEIPEAVPFYDNHEHDAYDHMYANRFWRLLVQADRVFHEFRSRFTGKNSPVHFFWGSFDLAVTRFSGRPAPEHPGGIPNLPDWVTREAYSHEVSSAGFWPGGRSYPVPFFYSYAYPEPEGFSSATILPEAATYSKDFGEFILPYDAVREADDPDRVLLDFLQSTYEAAADASKWDRQALEQTGHPKTAE